jgi:hypothetical protein
LKAVRKKLTQTHGFAAFKTLKSRNVRRIQLGLIVALIAISCASCARALAKTEPAMPELVPPPPPPRVVGIYVDEPVPTVEPGPAETALNTPPPRPPARPPQPKPELPKPEPPRVEPERPSATAPALTLKPAPGASAITEASIRDLLDRANKNLQRVNYAALDADGRTQYDTARRFIQQADEALRGSNLVSAGKLADKAATMASVLVR